MVIRQLVSENFVPPMDNIYATHGLETRIVVALKYVNDPCNTMS